VNASYLFGVIGIVIGLAGLVFGYFTLTHDRFRSFLIRRRIKQMPAIFRKLVQEYRIADTIPNEPDTPKPWLKRTLEKDRIAEGLLRFAQGAGIGRDVLAVLQEDGHVVTLMKIIKEEPKAGDIALMAKSVMCQVTVHTDYRTLEAFDEIVRLRLMKPDERILADKILDTINGRFTELDHKRRVADSKKSFRIT